jgi:hypothetical protein
VRNGDSVVVRDLADLTIFEDKTGK